MRLLVYPCRLTLVLCMWRAPDSVMADAQDSRKAWFFIEIELLAIQRLRILWHERIVRISQSSKARLPACCLPPASNANPCKCLPSPRTGCTIPRRDRPDCEPMHGEIRGATGSGGRRGRRGRRVRLDCRGDNRGCERATLTAGSTVLLRLTAAENGYNIAIMDRG